MKIAFYKAEGDWTDKLIRFWTGGNYSHCEIVIDELWYSSSWYDGGVRCKNIILNKENWDVFELSKDDEKFVLELFEKTKNSKYDIKGIFLSNIFAFNIHSKNKYWCSEWCAIALKLKNTNLDPNELFLELNKKYKWR